MLFKIQIIGQMLSLESLCYLSYKKYWSNVITGKPVLYKLKNYWSNVITGKPVLFK